MRILILNEKGHQELQFVDVKEAVQTIQKIPNRWVFVDGEFVSETENITEDAIKECQEIIITTKLIGG